LPGLRVLYFDNRQEGVVRDYRPKHKSDPEIVGQSQPRKDLMLLLPRRTCLVGTFSLYYCWLLYNGSETISLRMISSKPCILTDRKEHNPD